MIRTFALGGVGILVEVRSVVGRFEAGHVWRLQATLVALDPVDTADPEQTKRFKQTMDSSAARSRRHSRFEPLVLLDVLGAGLEAAKSLGAVRGEQLLHQVL